MDAHRVDVLDRADDDDVVVLVAHQLELKLLPAEHRLLEQDLGDRTGVRPAPAIRSSSAAVRAIPEPVPPSVNDGRTTTGNPSSAAAAAALVEGVADPARWHLGADADHDVLELLRSSPALIASMPAPISSTSYLASVPAVVQGDGGVERGLAAERRQERVGPLPGDDLASTSGVIGST